MPRQIKSARRLLLLLEAVVLLGISRLALRVMPFRHIAGILDHSLLPGKVGRAFSPVQMWGRLSRRRSRLPMADSRVPDREQKRRNVRWAIARGSVLLPGNTVCFPQGIAAHLMCRRRGIDTTLYYGAAIRPGTGLTAHVWLQDGSNGVVGTREADKYVILAQFPVRS